MVSVTHLRAFHFVALSGGYSQAAREMAVSQSTLSTQVRQLEAGSGAVLFERGPRGVTMTGQGEALYAVTTRLFRALTDATTLLNSRKDIGGHLRVATDGTGHTLPILKALRRKRPNLTFAIQLHNSGVVMDHVLHYRADVGISALAADDQRLHVQPLLTSRIGVFLPVTHEWAGRESMKLQELRGQPIVLRETGSRTRAVFEQNMAGRDIATGSVIEVSSLEGVRETVAAGFGVGIIADSDFVPDPRLYFIPLADAEDVIKEYVVCLAEKRRQPMIAEFFRSAEDVFMESLSLPA